MQVLRKLSEFNKVTLVWIPGHQGGRQAKEGATEVPHNQCTRSSWNRGIRPGGLPVLAADIKKC
jgi:hypothetical protein